MNPPIEIIRDPFPELTVYVGLDGAIIGVGSINQAFRVVYDEPLIIQLLQDELELTYIEAVEHFQFNISGMYVGEDTPLFFTPVEELHHE